jgi:ribonuclease HII
MGRLRTRAPALTEERAAWDDGCQWVAGVDEVGRGAWAGPITVAAVVVPVGERLRGVRDSKQLSRGRRSDLVPRIEDWAVSTSVGHADAAECDALGMSEAQRLAARRAMAGLSVRPDRVLADGKWDFVGGARMIVGGDRRSVAIAAASVVAKEARDRLMRDLDDTYPWWGFAHHVGYPAPIHRAALAAWGPSAIHRVSWRWADDLVWEVRQPERGQTRLAV